MADFNIGLYYRFTRLDTGRSVIMKRDADPPTLTSVGARWNTINRPRRGSFTIWEGNDPYRMDVPILFDGWDKLESVENEIGILSQMRRSPSDYVQPPTVKIEGAVPVKGATWILETDITWGTNVIWHEDGYRLRQDAVVHLLEYVPIDSISVKPPATNRTYTVKAGDTLKSISRDMYGTTKFWSAIKNANNIRDPKKLPKVLRIPAIISP